MTRHPLRPALPLLWLALTAASLPVLLAPLLLPPEAILQAAAALRSPHDRCFLCGMTRALVALGNGRFREAAALSPAAVPLYLGLLANLSLAALALLRRLSRGFGPAGSTPGLFKERPCRP